jgi:hypothetical protein
MWRKAAIFLLLCPVAVVCAAMQQIPWYGPNVFPNGIVINNTKLSNAPRMTWTGYWSTGSTSISAGNLQANTWLTSMPITITRLDLHYSASLSGCTTFPVYGIYDSTTSNWVATVTMSSGAFSNKSTQNGIVNAGDTLNMGVQTASSGCTASSPIIVWWTVEYQMQ